jgi:uncharacterized membrane protein YciS (DUF1049 family)
MKALGRLFWAVLAVVLFCFALLAVNQSQVALRFLAWRTPEISVFWWLLLAFLLGATVTALGFGLASLKLRMRQRALNKELDASRRELEKLRTLTFPD